MSTPKIAHAPCNPNYYIGSKWADQARGVTTWNLDNEFTVSPILAPDNNATVVFTCTKPKCYSSSNTGGGTCTLNMYGQDACMVVYNAWRTSGSDKKKVQLQYTLNNVHVGGQDLSEVATHGATQAFDFVCYNNSTCDVVYNDMGRNTLVIHNSSDTGVTIQLDHVKIYRIYKMCNPHAEEGGYCTFPVSGPCTSLTPTSTLAGFDSTRTDTPCNCSGGGLSYTHYQDTTYQGKTLQAGKTFSWTFNFGTLNNAYYDSKSICLFNFNAMWPMRTMASGDVTLDVQLNGSPIDTYYLSRQGSSKVMQPSHDLAKEEGIYRDTLPNTVSLINRSTVDVRMVGTHGGIDIYRIFKTSTIDCCNDCQTCQTCQEPCEICQSCYGCQTCIACYSCYIACQDGCEVSCETGCEVSCESGCEVSCQTGCQVSCQSGCEVACQTTCELACQTGCQVSCQTGCEVSCQTGCEVSCQTGCEVTCQTGCEVACQDCQTCQACDAGCQFGEGGCEPYCYACESCQTCESCQATCQGCQTGCEVSCETGCQVTCQTGCQVSCQTGCEVNCQTCEGGCEPGCYACQDCQTNQ